MSSPIPGPIPLATSTQQGQVSTTAQSIGGQKLFLGGAATSVFDIRNYGAISAATPYTTSQALVDCSDAFDAAIMAWVQFNSGVAFGSTQNRKVGGIYVPTGNWYISRPLFLPASCVLYGDGMLLSNVLVGPGTSATPSLVQGFAGPTVPLYGLTNFDQAPQSGLFPTYTAPLVGGTGQAMVMSFLIPPALTSPTLILDECYGWTGYMLMGLNASQISLQHWASITPGPNGIGNSIIGSWGPNIGWPSPIHSAIAIYTTSNGSTVTVFANLTTTGSGQQTISQAGVTAGTHHFEIDYNGAFFDFYIDGVNVGHVAMTGNVIKYPWESATIGEASTEWGGVRYEPITGAIDSIRLSNIARHTGTGSFSPPTQKYTADANTLWLCNFDQPGMTPPSWGVTGQQYPPFVVAQAAVSTSGGSFSPTVSLGNLQPHYCRIEGTYTVGLYLNNNNITIRDIYFYPNSSAGGVVGFNASRTRLTNVGVAWAQQFGLKINDGGSFYCTIDNIWIYNAAGTGINYAGNSSNLQTQGCAIGQQLVQDGEISQGDDQPPTFSFIPFIAGPGGSSYSTMRFDGVTGNDEEGGFAQQACALLIISPSHFVSTGNIWDVGEGSTTTPAIVLINPPPTGIHFIGDTIFTSGGFPFLLVQGPPGTIVCDECSFPLQAAGAPLSNSPGMVVVRTGKQATNQIGISITDTQANNLAGEFTIQFGYTSGGPTFAIPEPNGNYLIVPTYLGYFGSTPATGSTVPGPITPIISADGTSPGFIMGQGTMQTGTCTTLWGWILIRIPGVALGFSYLPDIPGSMANPMAGRTGAFATGITYLPTGGVALFDNTVGPQSLADCGTPTTNWWELGLNNGAQINSSLGANALSADSFVWKGKLHGIANPRTHNIVIYVGTDNTNVPGFEGAVIGELYVDGGLAETIFPSPNTGTQQATIHFGERSGGTDSLTTGTLRDFKIDPILAQAITLEQDSGPQVSETQAAFFGDEMTLGLLAGAAGLGGFASQVAVNRLGTIYYWLAAKQNATVAADITPVFWGQWGANQTSLQAVCFMAGFWDILNGANGTTTWNLLTQAFDGIPATSTTLTGGTTIITPTSNTQAWAFFVTPDEVALEANVIYTGTTATCVIDGITLSYAVGSPSGSIPTPTTVAVTVANLITAISANGTLAALVTPSDLFTQNHIHHALYIEAIGLGSLGNGITYTTDGGGGALWYPTGPTANGSNVAICINAVTFQFFFDTDANTSVDDIITLINADGPTAALITPSNTGGGTPSLLLSAVAPGVVGNSIKVQVGYSFTDFSTAANTFLTGGADGAVQKGIDPIIICTIPPFGNATGYSSAKETQRNAFNTLARAFSASGVTLADVDVTLRDSADHTVMDPTYLSADNTNPNDAGHAALYGLISPLLP